MSSLNQPTAWDGTGHPPLELLRQYHEETLPDGLRHRLERHLLDCARCADVAEGMALADRGQTAATVTDITRQINASIRPARNLNKPALWSDWRAAAALVGLLLSAVVVLYFQFTKVQSGELATLPPAAEQQEIRGAEPPVLRSAEPPSELASGETSGEEFLPPPPAPMAQRDPEPIKETPTRILKYETVVAGEVVEEAPVPDQIAVTAAPDRAAQLQRGTTGPDRLASPTAPTPSQIEESLQGRVAGVAASKARTQQMGEVVVTGNMIRGRVVSEAGQGLPGVTVLVKGKGRGVSTDAEGHFSLTLPDPQETLVINYIGYVPQEKPVTEQTKELQVRLEPNPQAQNQQVVARMAMQPTISGQVVSETGEGLPGVSVVATGTTVGVATAADGRFTISLPVSAEKLTFSTIGYFSQELPVTNETGQVQVQLMPNTKALSEVVVVGYGTQTSGTGSKVTSAAAPTGGLPAYSQYLKQMRSTLPLLQQEKVQGRVVVGFTVQPDGRLHNLRVLKALHPAADAEALRLVREGPAWQPAEKNGQKVPEEVKVTVRFNR